MAAPYDILIIGGGPGGYVAAIRAAQLGFRTAVVEREHLGGICLNWGCIPTKALLRSAEIYHYAQHGESYGLKLAQPGFDIGAVVKRSRGVSAQLNGGVAMLLKKNKVDVIWGEAKITKVGKGGPVEVQVGPASKPAVEPQNPVPKAVLPHGTYSAQHVIVATGARPRVLPGMEPDGDRIWTYFEAMKPAALPKSLIVMGSGAIGIEFASFYRAMGAEVTVVELLPQILPVEDAEIAAVARKQFEKQGMKILSNAKVAKVAKSGPGVEVTIEQDGKSQTLRAERLISAVGVQGNVDDLNLEALGVEMERGIIKVDGAGRTNVQGIYAIGDVAGAPMLAHKAEHEGTICVEAIKGMDTHPMKRTQIPGCTYCQPQIASVGLTEERAKEDGRTVKVGRFRFIGNGKAIALGEPEGMVKTIFDAKTGELLGAHMVGAEVTELIQGFVIAMGLETTEEELMHTVFPHPTLSEMMHESVLDAYGKVIHM
ncbi:dihydrolipoyl dehydrogenase [Aureimonas jatrophae]|uniref:Dihydrolipoyl dehydrogenase n=1 Tax=Aureimonas jatrophae TaxID=1166073 RepID=A0A1H0GY51_9HYPH|nr:dihydrolipoyl dehydrogenase [Aureimonas jatrophae]MBB3949864.1 dihydrolipoamide dehydrogenase [Aureimonas jatrophae]SDO11815.1 dihydrolipoamide dehydrogenase [Aureimonas jatrophae]